MSRDLNERARRVMPAGVSSPVRAYQAVGGTPVALDHAKGAEVVDVEGRTYIDLVSAYGAIVLGHGHPRVAEAVATAARQGLNVAAPQEEEVRLAERLTGHHPGADWLRFVNSGTEAVMSALRLARGATGRDLVLKFDGCYHGHWDPLLVKSGSGTITFGQGSSAGLPEGMVQDTAVLPLDDEEALERFFETHGEDLAAAIIEPVGANAGLLPQRPAFLTRLQELCHEHGALLVLDEIVTGFRFGWGAITGQLDLKPDLVTLGKVIGGGLPIGAYGGRADLVHELVPEGRVYQAGTASGNRAAMAAGNAVLDVLEDHADPFGTLERSAKAIASGAEAALADQGLQARQAGPLAWLAFHPDPLSRASGFLTQDGREAYAALHRAARDQGLLLPPSPFECLFPTLAFDPGVTDLIAQRLAAAASTLEVTP